MPASEKPAVAGGKKAVKARLGHWPQFDAATVKAVAGVLASGKVNYWTGPKGMEFEKEFARWMGARFAVSTSSGTSALHTAPPGCGARRSWPLVTSPQGPGGRWYSVKIETVSCVSAAGSLARRAPWRGRFAVGKTAHRAHTQYSQE